MQRFKTLFNGMIHGAAGKLETDNPQWLIADAEEKIRKSRKKAQQQLIEIQTWTEMIRLDLREIEAEAETIQDQIELAKNHGDKELLAGLILKQDNCQEYYLSKKQLYENAVAEALRIRDNYHRFESEMNEKTRLLKNIKSQSRLAEIRGGILKLEESYGQNSDLTDSMDKLRFAVNQQSARIMVAEQLQKESITAKIANLEHGVKWNNALERADALLKKG